MEWKVWKPVTDVAEQWKNLENLQGGEFNLWDERISLFSQKFYLASES